MPLVLWPVQPSYLYRNNTLTNDPDVLRAQRLHGLTNILRQLSSISLNIEDIFVGISADIESIQLRSQEISNRVNRLRGIVKKAYNVESTLDPELKEWTMNIKIGAPTVARNTLPEPIEKLYNSCVSVPCLEKLDKFNTDGSKCMNNYSKPEFFFEQWITAFDKDIAIKQEKRMKKKEERKIAKAEKKPAAPSVSANKAAQPVVPESKPPAITSKKSPNLKTKDHISVTEPPIKSTVAPPVSSHIESIKATPPVIAPKKVSIDKTSAYEYNIEVVNKDIDLSTETPYEEPLDIAPPDIAPLEISASAKIDDHRDESAYKVNEVKAPAPPPPPPPVAIMQVSKPVPPPPKAPGLPPTVGSSPAPAKPASSGSPMDLLSAIRMGKELKTVTVTEKKDVEQFAGNDVASILARRIQLAGDSDSDSSEGDDDVDDWD